jgi:hypothetical protein
MIRTENPYAKILTYDDVRAIRTERRTKCTGCGRLPTYASIGLKYGVSAATICNIMADRIWK